MSAVTTEIVATWMARQVQTKGALHQDDAVEVILREFGDEFVYDNDNGNLAIARPVLRAFRNLTNGSIVWDREHRMWRPREPGDAPGRQQ
ncbi:hypothetical protein ABZ738_31445 [Micromonospora sp. NPDC047793]|uniref:DUF6953 family protein n=1 Tax=Micromonospora sp. NPDC047793 TaxID=3154342 RepID=UPI0033DD858B